MLAGPTRELKYLLRAYDAKGNFDETDARPLWLYREPSAGARRSRMTSSRELLAAYGESDLARQRIPLGGGTVKVQGSGIPADYTVWVAGRQVPVDPQGAFVAEEMLPAGTHTVEVAVLDAAATARSICATWSSSAGISSTSVWPMSRVREPRGGAGGFAAGRERRCSRTIRRSSGSCSPSSGLSMLFISHNLAVVRYVAKRIAVMYRGRIVEEGPAEQVLDDPSHEYTRTLLTALPQAHKPIHNP